MRTRALVFIASTALIALPAVLSAQLRFPRGRRTSPQPTTLPPEAPAVARAQAYKRSRFTAESYSLVSMLQAPTNAGVASRYTTFGAGSRIGYRYTDQWSATMDLTVSPYGGSTTTATAEVGTRFSPLPWDEQLRPFFDLRGGYTRMYDEFATVANPSGGVGAGGAFEQQYANEARYAHGFGGIAGAGFDVSLTNSLALSTEFMATRNRMRVYRVDGVASLPVGGSSYWMTAYRIAFGLKFNPVYAAHLAQTVTH
jgi:hypothetical protein